MIEYVLSPFVREFFPQTFMKAITTFVSGLFLSVLLLLPVSVRSAELQPFFTLKTSSINTLIGVAEKISTMAGFADDAEFREIVNSFRNIRGIDGNGIIGIAAAVDDFGGINPILLLPITDLEQADIPGQPDIFDFVRSLLVGRGEGKFDINSPFGSYVAVQQQNYLLVTSADTAALIPADPAKLFADLEQYTFGVKLNLEQVEFETLEAQLFGPMLFMTMMTNPEAVEQVKTMIELYRELYKEIAAASFGIAFNPQTADVELAMSMAPREGSDVGKSLAGYRQQPTIFGGFRGTPENIIFSFGDSATQLPIENNPLLENSMQQWEAILEGFLAQIEMEDETGELTELAESASGLIHKILETESKRGVSDLALSMNADGTILAALGTASLAEIQQLAALAVGFAAPKLVPVAADFDIDFYALVRLNYETIEGFRVSSFRIPMENLIPLAPSPNEGLKEFSPGVFWAVKAGDNQAVAFAVGLDSDKTEQAFKSALEQTKTAVPVQKPEGVFSITGLGKFLGQTICPAAAKDGADHELKQVADVFAAAGSNATVTLSSDVAPDRINVGFHVAGKVIETIITAVKLMNPEEGSSDRRPVIRDF